MTTRLNKDNSLDLLIFSDPVRSHKLGPIKRRDLWQQKQDDSTARHSTLGYLSPVDYLNNDSKNPKKAYGMTSLCVRVFAGIPNTELANYRKDVT